jgi:bifunctional non-homologous end joining protein LigD
MPQIEKGHAIGMEKLHDLGRSVRGELGAEAKPAPPPSHRADAGRGGYEAPEGPGWSYELKFDGSRTQHEGGRQVRLLSRNGKDFTRRFVSIARALGALPDNTVIDSEIVAYNDDGRPSFNVLQTSAAPLVQS